MLSARDRFRLLHGPYRMPRRRVGRFLKCQVRGQCRVTAISDARISWPMTHNAGGGRPFLIVCGDLVKAIRRESATAVAHWWGVTAQTVTVWRNALGVEQNNRGTRRLRSRWYVEGGVGKAMEPGRLATYTPERNAKIAAARRGKPRPRHVIEAMRKGRTGKPHSEEARTKMSEAARAEGAYPPAAGRPFTAEEDALLGSMTDREAAERSGRDHRTIANRRRHLGIASYRSVVGHAGRRRMTVGC